MQLISLSFKTTNNFDNNLNTLVNLINQTPSNSIIVAPEICLSGYVYDRLDKASKISLKAIKILQQLSTNKIISTTFIIKQDNCFYNTLYIFYKNKIIHTQSKYKLFSLNDEKKYFCAGDEADIKIIDIDGIKIGALICFELRFIDLWEKLQGVDILLIPAMWGKPRKDNLLTLTKALAIINQCYVIISNSKNIDMAKGSGIIDPFGNEYRNDTKNILSAIFDKKQIKKMRKYMNIGLL
jgi:predicted amidohydrolase